METTKINFAPTGVRDTYRWHVYLRLDDRVVYNHSMLPAKDYDLTFQSSSWLDLARELHVCLRRMERELALGIEGLRCYLHVTLLQNGWVPIEGTYTAQRLYEFMINTECVLPPCRRS